MLYSSTAINANKHRNASAAKRDTLFLKADVENAAKIFLIVRNAKVYMKFYCALLVRRDTILQQLHQCAKKYLFSDWKITIES